MDVVPDAVLRSPDKKRRVFVELDRSNKDLGRIRHCLVRYDAVFQHADLGGDAPSLLFVVRSAARKENIRNLAHRLPLVVLQDVEAVEWLREEILGTPRRRSTERTPVHGAAFHAYDWMTRLHSVLEANGMRDALYQAEPALMEEGYERLSALRRTLTALETQGARA
jgi:hypothetical protein